MSGTGPEVHSRRPAGRFQSGSGWEVYRTKEEEEEMFEAAKNHLEHAEIGRIMASFQQQKENAAAGGTA
jgi:hypothetical protein